MMRKLMAVVAGMGVISMASMAHAQGHEGFGRRGQFIISADRLVPVFSFTHAAQDAFDPGPGNSKVVRFNNQSASSILWGGTAAGAGDSFFTVPRVGFDYVLLPHFTVGGNIVVAFTLGGSSGADTTRNNGTTFSTSADNGSGLTFGVAPRAGYLLELSDLFSLWLRGGVSYYVTNLKNNSGTSVSTNQFALDLDPQFVITPISHFGITVGLTADIPVAGGHSQQNDNNGVSVTQSASSSILFFGVTAGLLGYF